MLRRLRLARGVTADASGQRRRGSVQGVNTLLLIVFVGVLLYFLARTQIDEPITWLIRRVQSAAGM
jgi:hypothetical protein